MAIIKCKMCGGDLENTPGITVAECEYCGTKQTLPKVNEEVIQNLFNRANALRLKCEFDKAEQIYEKILQENDFESEAHWGIVLCKYGIEYVEDPKTYKRIPTCHRTSYDAVTADADYLAAIEYADAVQRDIYEAEAKAIDKIQKNILSIVKDEKPFDVFICYKETDESGKRTIDSSIGNDIYYQLTQEGLKVFYAAITLEDKLGQEYEPYIFAALNSAKVMLVIGTKPQYFTAVWVKNEWSRFLKLMKTDRSKLLIPCYKDMDAYELPEEFAHLQAQDMGKIGFINDVVRGIRKVTLAEGPKPAVIKETVVTGSNVSIAPLLKRAFMFLEDGDWNSANEYCEKVLDVDPECAEAYLGKLMAALRVKQRADLKDQAEPFDSSNHYQKTVRFADEKLKTELAGYIEHINTRNENTRLEGIYNRAKNIMASATAETTYKEAARLFESIIDYNDSAALVQECYGKAEMARKDAVLVAGRKKMVGGFSPNYEAALQLFESIPGWKDADANADICKKKLEEARLKREQQAERARQEAAKAAKRKKIAAIVVAAIACAAIAFVILLNTVIIPNGYYNDAVALMKAGKYADAISAFEALNGYRDSTDKIAECNTAILDDKYDEAIALMDAGWLDEAHRIFKELGDHRDASEKAANIRLAITKEALKSVKAGDHITFGVYEQDNNTDNGKERIEWLVLDVKDGKALVVSKYALDNRPYNTDNLSTTWEDCTLRMWLNNSFLSTAFSENEKAMIPTVMVPADGNPNYDTDPGSSTQDHVFLLSAAEVGQYLPHVSSARCAATDYVIAQEAYTDGSDAYCGWWLRTPGKTESDATYVTSAGSVAYYGKSVSVDSAVRPALWIDLSFNLEEEYNEALSQIEAGNIVEAYEALIALDGYKDSDEIASSIYDEYMTQKFKQAKEGDYVVFGAYEQDNDTSNGKEPIEWRILVVRDDDKILLISKYALDCQPYHTNKNEDATWEDCSLRKWLNDSFLNTAFSENERDIIPIVTVSADENPKYDTDPGNATQDKVFLLSIFQASIYLNIGSGRECCTTEYVSTNGLTGMPQKCWWWLRTPGVYGYNAAYINHDGNINEIGIDISAENGAVRPAIWIDLSKIL